LVYFGSIVQLVKYDIETQGSDSITLAPNTNYSVSGHYALTMLYTAIASVSISLLFNLILLIATLKEVPILILGWITYASIGVVIQVIGGIFNVVYAVGVDAAVLTLLLSIAAILIQVYMIVVVKSYWQELKEMRSVLRSSSQLFACDAVKQPDFFPCHPPPYTSYDATAQQNTVEQ